MSGCFMNMNWIREQYMMNWILLIDTIMPPTVHCIWMSNDIEVKRMGSLLDDWVPVLSSSLPWSSFALSFSRPPPSSLPCPCISSLGIHSGYDPSRRNNNRSQTSSILGNSSLRLSVRAKLVQPAISTLAALPYPSTCSLYCGSRFQASSLSRSPQDLIHKERSPSWAYWNFLVIESRISWLPSRSRLLDQPVVTDWTCHDTWWTVQISIRCPWSERARKSWRVGSCRTNRRGRNPCVMYSWHPGGWKATHFTSRY